MPLSILLLLVVGGIATIAVALHLLGLTGQRRFLSNEQAIAAWHREFGVDHVRAVYRNKDLSAALITLADGIGLVWAMGADTTARHLTGATVVNTKTGLKITLPDYTAPKIAVTLTPAEAAEWAALMQENQP